MKWILFAGALMVSGAAVAQTAPMPAPAEPMPQTAPMPATAPMPDQTAPMPATAAQPVTTVTTEPDPATGAQAVTSVNVASPGNYTAPPAPDPAASYPWCTRTVTDHCKQRRDPK